jgi:hypothetical protein
MSIENSHQLMTGYANALRSRSAYDEYFSDDVTVSLMGYDREVTGRTAARQSLIFPTTKHSRLISTSKTLLPARTTRI